MGARIKLYDEFNNSYVFKIGTTANGHNHSAMSRNAFNITLNTIPGGTVHGQQLPSQSAYANWGWFDPPPVQNETGTDIFSKVPFLEGHNVSRPLYTMRNQRGSVFTFEKYANTGNPKQILIVSGNYEVIFDFNNDNTAMSNTLYFTFVTGANLSQYDNLTIFGVGTGEAYGMFFGGKATMLNALFFSSTDDDLATRYDSNNLLIVDDPNNPYSGGEYSEPGGGNSNKQNWNDASDFVNPDAMPDESSIGAVNSGLLTIFTPSKTQLGHLASLLWSNDFFSFVEKSLTGIEDLFVSLGIVPFVVTAGSVATVTWLNYSTLGPSQIATSVHLTKAANQFMEFNMGNVSLTGNDDRMFATDSVLDYSPYSRLGIYLPFIGYQELDIDECREKTINLKYRIDILSGACVALISINGRTLYQFSGNCITQIPLTSADYSQAINTAVNVGIAATSMGTSAAVASAGDALTASKAGNPRFSKEMGEYQNVQHAAMVSNAENSLAGATANGFMGMKPNFKKTGAISGSTGLLSVKQPYLCLTTPRQSMPEGYEKVCGFPCNMGGKLGSFSGYTVVEDIRLNGLVATSPEVEEIYNLLKSGVII